MENTIDYLSTYLQRRGLSFDHINSFQEEKEQLAEKLSRGKKDKLLRLQKRIGVEQ